MALILNASKWPSASNYLNESYSCYSCVQFAQRGKTKLQILKVVVTAPLS